MKQGVLRLCPGVTVLGGKVRAPGGRLGGLGVHAAPGEGRGEAFISHLPLLPQVDKHQRARLEVCTVTKTLDFVPRKDLGTKIAVPV